MMLCPMIFSGIIDVSWRTQILPELECEELPETKYWQGWPKVNVLSSIWNTSCAMWPLGGTPEAAENA